MNFVLLEAAAHDGFSPWWVGIIFLAVLLGALLFIRNMGKGRPHA